jgi:hypothetical protein
VIVGGGTAAGAGAGAVPLGLYALVAFGGLALGLVLALLSSVVFDASFWRVLGVTEVLSLVTGMAWLLLKQRRDVKKTIHYYPKPGESRSHMEACFRWTTGRRRVAAGHPRRRSCDTVLCGDGILDSAT